MTRWRLMLLVLLAAGLATSPARAQAPKPPLLKATLVVRDGRVGVDPQRSTLDLGDRAGVFTETCGLTPETIRTELVAYLDGVFRGMGPVLDRLAIPPVESPDADPDATAARRAAEAGLRELVRDDPATSELAALNADWPRATALVDRWMIANRGRRPAVATGDRRLFEVYRAARHHPALADGPLLPRETDPDAFDRAQALAGEIEFRLLPPWVDTAHRLRPERNVAQWEALRGDISAQVLAPLDCTLWRRERIVGRVQDYLELRGLSAKPYRSARDEKAATDAGLRPVPLPPPPDHAGIAPERPRFADDGSLGGRVLLLPDPLVRTVYVETGDDGSASPWPALYLLLPSEDFAALRRAPAEYLCRTKAIRTAVVEGAPEAQAVRLRLDVAPGAALEFARLYLTRRALAARLQRLQAIGYSAATVAPEDERRTRLRRTTLLIQRGAALPADATAAGSSGAGAEPLVPSCPDGPPDAGPEAADTDTDAADDARPDPGAAGRAAAGTTQPLPHPRDADLVEPAPLRPSQGADLRHQLLFSVERRAGKPWAAGIAFSRAGIGQGDSFAVGVGVQGEALGDVRYSSDFVGFGVLGRRLQLSARGYSDYDPERPVDATSPDERRTGLDLRATLDLWRDRRGSFGQAELGLARSEVEQVGSGSPGAVVTLADLTLIAAHDDAGTGPSPHSEAVMTLAGGRSAGRSFGKAAVELAHHRFAGVFTRWDVRLRAAAVGSAAPVSEYVPFGGEESVRGFRSEAALARRAWALQAEYWFPLPWTPGSESLARVLRRNLTLAAFADLGGLSGSTTALQGRQAGAGIGLRYAHGQALTLKLDIAHPISAYGDVPGDDRRVRIHFSVGTQRVL